MLDVHGKVTGLSVESRIPSHVLRTVAESMLCRVRPDMLLVEKTSSDGTQPSLHDLEHHQYRSDCKIHHVKVGLCMEAAHAQKCKEKYEQHCTLLEHLRNADDTDVQLHLLIFGSTGKRFKLTAFHLNTLGIPHSKWLACCRIC